MKATLREYLAGKRVALVGPAATTSTLREGQKLDRFDVLARVGVYYPPLKVDEVGSRTDIVYENFWHWHLDPDKAAKLYRFYQAQEVKFFVQVYRRDRPGPQAFARQNNGRIPFEVFTGPERDEVVKHCGPSPTKGIFSIAALLAQPIARLYVTGFTFNHGIGYRVDYNPIVQDPKRLSKAHRASQASVRKTQVLIPAPPHDVVRELAFFTRLFRRDSRVAVDSILREIVDANRK